MPIHLSSESDYSQSDGSKIDRDDERNEIHLVKLDLYVLSFTFYIKQISK